MDRSEAHQEIERLIVAMTTTGNFDRTAAREALDWIEQDPRTTLDQLPSSIAGILHDEVGTDIRPSTYGEAVPLLRRLLELGE